MIQPPQPGTPPIAVFALTRGGVVLAERLAEMLQAELWIPSRHAAPSPAGVAEGVAPTRLHTFSRVGPALRAAFSDGRQLVCVMSTGVVFRSLASCLGSKQEDPAVVALDEAGRYVIPLLSGHLGGANALASRLAEALGGQAALTTSSDVQGFLGPDLLAERLRAAVLNPERLTETAAALVEGEQPLLRYEAGEVGDAEAFLRSLAGYRAAPLTDAATSSGGAGAATAGEEGHCVLVSMRAAVDRSDCLALVPRWVCAGVGCKRGTADEAIRGAVAEGLNRAGLHPRSLGVLATVEAKADETGLLEAAEALGVPLRVATAGQLQAVVGSGELPESDFVREQVGVGAVAEPAALWAAGERGRLLMSKMAGSGVTVALAVMDGGRVVES